MRLLESVIHLRIQNTLKTVKNHLNMVSYLVVLLHEKKFSRRAPISKHIPKAIDYFIVTKKNLKTSKLVYFVRSHKIT